MQLMRSACLTLLLAATAVASETDLRTLTDRVKQLDDRDPHVRETARVALMGLTAADIPYLKKAVVAAGPVRPHRAEALRQVVTYLFTRQAVARIPRQSAGFLGVKLEAGIFLDPDEPAAGAAVTELVAGFVAARFLEVGDVVLGITTDGQTEWVGRGQTVTDIVGKLRAGKTVDVLISRSGRPMTFTLVLDGRPDFTRAGDSDRAAWDYLMTEQVEVEADAEFDKQFGSLVGES